MKAYYVDGKLMEHGDFFIPTGNHSIVQLFYLMMDGPILLGKDLASSIPYPLPLADFHEVSDYGGELTIRAIHYVLLMREVEWKKLAKKMMDKLEEKKTETDLLYHPVPDACITQWTNT